MLSKKERGTTIGEHHSSIVVASTRTFASRAFYNPSLTHSVHTIYNFSSKFSVFPSEIHELIIISIFLKERLMTRLNCFFPSFISIRFVWFIIRIYTHSMREWRVQCDMDRWPSLPYRYPAINKITFLLSYLDANRWSACRFLVDWTPIGACLLETNFA